MKNRSVISISGLVKDFGRFRALNGLNLEVKEKEIHGFLGPNGSGKSTTIRILLGLLNKTTGQASLFDSDPWKDSTQLHRRLAYVPGDVNLWPNLSGGEIIDLLGDLRGGLDEKLRTELLESFSLDPTKKFRTYSKGSRQKVALVAALASDVELYVLDEPTSGFDPLMEAVFQIHMRKLKQRGKTVLLSSHILAEVEALCDTVTIIRDGKTVETGKLSNIQKLQRTTFRIETKKSAKEVVKLGGVHGYKEEGQKSTFEVEPGHLEAVVKLLATLELTHIISNPPKLEKLFLQLYKDKPEAK